LQELFHVLENNTKVELNPEKTHKEDPLDRTNIQRMGGLSHRISTWSMTNSGPFSTFVTTFGWDPESFRTVL